MPKALTPLFIFTAVVLLWLELSLKSFTYICSRLYVILFLLFFTLSAASLLWTISPYETQRSIIPLLGLFLLGALVLNIAQTLRLEDLGHIQTTILIGSIVGFFIIAIEISTPLAITSFFHEIFKGRNIIANYTYSNFFRNGANISSLILFPAVAILYQRYNKYFSFALIFLALVVLYFSKAGGALLAVIIGLSAAGLTYKFNHVIPRFFKFVLIIFVLVFPTAISSLPSADEIENSYPNLPNSVYPRIFIWQSSAKYILVNPILGKGFNTSRAISKPEDRVVYNTKTNNNGLQKRGSVPIPLHPHSAVMQIWLELGLLGIGLFLAFLLATINSIEKATTSIPKRALAYGSFFSAFTIANISYGIWQNWWVSSLWLTAVLTIIAIRDGPTSASSAKDTN